MGYNYLVDAKPRRIIFYRATDGRQPFTEWFSTLRDQVARDKIRTRLDRVEDGNFGTRRWVGEGVWELKIHQGPGYRVYFGLDGAEIVVLLCGGDKRPQDQDIHMARTFWADYLSRRA